MALIDIRYTNEFTRDCDSFLLEKLKPMHRDFDLKTEIYISRNPELDRIYNNPVCASLLFRYPGATRGAIIIDVRSGVICDVLFNDTAYKNLGVACYTEEVATLKYKYLGKPMPDLLKAIRNLADEWAKQHPLNWPEVSHIYYTSVETT